MKYSEIVPLVAGLRMSTANYTKLLTKFIVAIHSEDISTIMNVCIFLKM